MDRPEFSSSRRSWRQKFRDAFRGVAVGVVGENSFWVHVPVAIAVMVAALWLQCSIAETSVLLLCISTVLVAELFNSALERLAKAVTSETNELVRDTLDIASGAVLVAAAMASLVGAIVLVNCWMG